MSAATRPQGHKATAGHLVPSSHLQVQKQPELGNELPCCSTACAVSVEGINRHSCLTSSRVTRQPRLQPALRQLLPLPHPPSPSTLHHGLVEPLHQRAVNHQELPGCCQLYTGLRCSCSLGHLWTMGSLHRSCAACDRVSA